MISYGGGGGGGGNLTTDVLLPRGFYGLYSVKHCFFGCFCRYVSELCNVHFSLDITLTASTAFTNIVDLI